MRRNFGMEDPGLERADNRKTVWACLGLLVLKRSHPFPHWQQFRSEQTISAVTPAPAASGFARARGGRQAATDGDRRRRSQQRWRDDRRRQQAWCVPCAPNWRALSRSIRTDEAARIA